MAKLNRRNAFLALLIVLYWGCAPRTATKVDPPHYLPSVEAREFDTGKMWTFDYPPIEYLQRTYDFSPGPEWFEHARLSALRIPGCSASLVSADGLVMTNQHCAEGSLVKVNRQGENLPQDGFYAKSLDEERRIPDYYAEVHILIDDVTEEVHRASEMGKTDQQRIELRRKKIAELEKTFKDSTGLNCSVVALYNGGRYSLYGYKRYTDVRFVFAPENKIAYFGGDHDNFTYPRYNLDVAFYRIYDEDEKPLTVDRFFRWNSTGASDGELVFVVGNPGRTNRLRTIAQLEYFRDVAYPYIVGVRERMVSIYREFIENHPDHRLVHYPRLLSLANAQKAFTGQLNGLRNPSLMARKMNHERRIRETVMANSTLRSRYGRVWNELAKIQKEKAAQFPRAQAYLFRGVGRSAFFMMATDIIDYARQMMLPEEERAAKYRGDELEKTKARIVPENFTLELEQSILSYQLEYMKSVFGVRNVAFNTLLAAQSPAAAAERLLAVSVLTTKESVDSLLREDPRDVLQSTDPFITFVLATEADARAVRNKTEMLNAREASQSQVLGQVLYDIFGTSIPPDATFTLRINDGVVKGFEYNGTIAPHITTFYGAYDRYYSFGGRQPWDLPDRWKTPPPTFNRGIPFNFVTTNDITGGNSGSPIVNKKLEVVGVAFDGNMESLPGDFLYDDEKNRCVGVHSAGIIEVLKNVYKADRLVRELTNGSIVHR